MEVSILRREARNAVALADFVVAQPMNPVSPGLT
jgi:hypothetical protein